jgi:uncharacterized protein GlcG (DUF336 family)
MKLSDARLVVEAAKRRAEELDVPMSIAVVDGSGHLVALERMDGAGFITSDLALGKAWTAAAFGAPTGALADRFANALPFSVAVTAATNGRFTPRQGALPVPGGGGAGASGGAPDQDEEVVRAGLEALASSG